MKITYYEQSRISQFRIREWEHETTVLDVPPMRQGELYYFKKNEFEYLVLVKDSQGRWVK